jgi:hypothetical protein
MAENLKSPCRTPNLAKPDLKHLAQASFRSSVGSIILPTMILLFSLDASGSERLNERAKSWRAK